MNNIKIDKILKSSRKTFSLEITNEGYLLVRAPLRASMNDINNIVNEKANWILKKKEEVKRKAKQKIKKKFLDGDKFVCLGKEYSLVIEKDYKWAFAFQGDKLILNSEYKPYAEQILVEWYKNRAYNYISQRAIHFAEKMEIDYKNIKINSARTRWGSCSSKKNLNFSWRLAMAPKQVVDYVIVHELAHVIELNHSQKFWKIVAKILPNFKIYENWLKENGHLLDI